MTLKILIALAVIIFLISFDRIVARFLSKENAARYLKDRADADEWATKPLESNCGLFPWED